MPKKKNARNSKNKRSKNDVDETNTALTVVDEATGQRYARVERALGGGRFSVVICTGQKWDTKPYIAIVPGKMRGRRRHRNNVVIGGIIAVQLREYESNPKFVDVIWTYTSNEINKLLQQKLLPHDDNSLLNIYSDVSERTCMDEDDDAAASKTDDVWNTSLGDFEFDDI